MSSRVWIIGGYQTDFARNYTREGLDFADLTREVVDGTLTAASVEAGSIGVIHLGNAFGQLFAGQGQLGAMPATVNPDLWGVPATRHEGACASGSLAVLAAIADLAAGHYDTALVIGVEIEKTVPGDQAARNLGAAAWVGHEGESAKFMWPHMFDRIADEYDRRFGLDDAHLRGIAQVNFANARRNPLAQTRTWDVGDLVADAVPDSNPVVEGRLRRYDCSQVTDGGAGVFLATDGWVRDHPGTAERALGVITGWGHRTVGLGLAQKFDRDRDNPYVMPHLRQAVADAFGRAGTDLDGIDGLETHDCFTPSEYLAIDHIGLTGPGESWKAVENGDIEIDGSFPINPSGGLIGGGHPVGASGIRMVFDAAKQVGGVAGAYQVAGADRFATLNFGGSTATVASFVVESVPA